MPEITIEIDREEVKKRLGDLSNQADKVIARAVNRASKTGRLAIAREVQKKYKVTQKEINKHLTIKKATPSKPNAVLQYKGKHDNLYLWNNGKGVSPKTVIKWSHGRNKSKPNVKVYKASIMKGSSKQLVGKYHNKPFVQKVKGKNGDFIGLFQREWSARDSKLVSVQAPAIPQIIKNKEVMEQFRRAAGPMLQKRLEHEIDFVLKGVVK